MIRSLSSLLTHAAGPAAIAAALAWLATRVLRERVGWAKVLDHPNARSLHTVPTPRTGGVAIGLAVALVLAGLWWLGGLPPGAPGASGAGTAAMLGFASVVFATSLLNDVLALPPLVRLVVQIGAATGFCLEGEVAFRSVAVPGLPPIPLGPLALPLTVLFIVWMANLYNFMDGMDGFAGGMLFLGCSFLAALFATVGASGLGTVALVMAGAGLGFLAHNFPPARIFMGDSGAVTIGFLVACLTVLGAAHAGIEPWLPGLVFSPFILDATMTLLRRTARGDRVWLPHREHYYQRLVLAGWGHRRTVLAEYALMLGCGLSAIVATRLSPRGQLGVLVAWVLVYAVLAYKIDAGGGAVAADQLPDQSSATIR